MPVEAARAPQPRIAVAPVPDEGIGRAINDRRGPGGLEALAFFSQIHEEPEHFKLEYLGVQSGSSVMATASVKLKVGQEIVSEAATGTVTINNANLNIALGYSGRDELVDAWAGWHTISVPMRPMPTVPSPSGASGRSTVMFSASPRASN